MYTKVGILLVGASLLFVSAHAGVIRSDSEAKTAAITTTVSSVTDMDEEVMPTTTESSPMGVDVDNNDGNDALAVSRDKDATVKLAAIATLDPAPGTVEDDEVVLLNPDGPSVSVQAEKLLLLSTPKLMERPKEQEEENIEEPEEIGEAETTTTVLPDFDMTTTMANDMADGGDELEKQHEEMEEMEDKPKVTKLYPINIDRSLKSKEELKEESPKDDGAEEENDERKNDIADTVKTASEIASLIDETPAITAQEPNDIQNDNAATAVLIETEADYVLVESDAEEFGTFTHADSDLHLQPIVESVEIVPTHVDEPLLVSYVHQW